MTDALDIARAVCRERGLKRTWNPLATIRALYRTPSARDLDQLSGETWLPDAENDKKGRTPESPLVAPAPREHIKPGASVAKGGMGWIRRATQQPLGREVAVKTLLPGTQSSTATAALLNEARVAGALEHPNILPIHDLVEEDSGAPMIVMKHIEGISWEDLIAEPEHPLLADHGLALDSHLEISSEVCQAVHFAHSRDVVHRDIKPANVMVGRYGEVNLLDWGVAVEAGTWERGIGTPAYMAPELVDGRRPATAQTDIYLLGATLNQILVGQARHTGGDVEAVLQAAVKSQAATYPPDVPAELAQICNRACDPDPQARFPDALAFRQALKSYKDHQNSVATSHRARASLEQLAALVAADKRDQEVSLQAHRSYSAARHGYDQAIDEWSDNAEALAGRQRALELMTRWELDRENAAGAANFLAELDPRPPHLSADLAAVEAAGAERVRAVDLLAKLKRDERIQGHNLGRSISTLANGAISVTAALLVAAGIRRGYLEPTVVTSIATGIVITILYVVGMVYFRRVILDNRADARMMIVLAFLGPMLILNRVAAFLYPRPLHAVLTADCMGFVAIAVVLAAVFDRLFWVSAAIASVVTVLVQLLPAYAVDMIGIAYGLNCCWLAWVVRPRAAASITPR